jgi:uncharacterized protein (TIGR03032 family)
LRDPLEIMARHSAPVPPGALRFKVVGDFWNVLRKTASTLVITREYEHLVVALSAAADPLLTWLGLPHPSGLAVDARNRAVHIACTRNPNEIVTLTPARIPGGKAPVLVPTTTQIFPGRLYLHDLAVMNGTLYGNAAGVNAVVELAGARATPVWWPKTMEERGRPRMERNYIQLNSIAAGKSLTTSFFTASSSEPSARRPGHLNYPVDGRGVVFSGASRTVVAGGLTRPHSARLHRGRLWVANSGYGELGWIDGDRFQPLVRPGGWTRGLAFSRDVAFVGTSRVLPRFSRYAPGVAPDRAHCGVHAINLRDGRLLGSILWPEGNQIFALDLVPLRWAEGLPFTRRGDRAARTRVAFAFERVRG